MIGVSLKLCQSFLISYFIFRVVSLNSSFTFLEVSQQLCISIASFIFNGRKSNIGYNILATISLTYLCLPQFGEKSKLISIFYLIKYFHLRKNLKQLSEWFTSMDWVIPFSKYFNFFFNFLRYSVLEYLFIGFMIMNYKIWNMFDPEDIPLPQDHQLYYQYFVTASTIGYGDITPKSKMQMIHFTLIIPIICGSFAVLLIHLSQIFTECFLTEQQNAKPSQKQLKTLILGIAKKFLPKPQINSLQQFIDKRKERQLRDINIHKALQAEGIPNDEIILAIYTYKKYKQFINLLYPYIQDTKTLYTLASLVKTTYYPKGEKILNKIQMNDSVLYCFQGKIASQSADASKSLINLDGFNDGKPSEKQYIAKTFAQVWSLSSSNIKNHFSEHFTWKVNK